MANKNYTTLQLVSQYLGTISSGVPTLTSDQRDQVATMIGAAEAYIDRETNRGWLTPAVTAERYDLRRDVLTLKARPVASVQSVTYRTTRVGDTLQTLTAGTDYELVDGIRGELRFVFGYHGPDTIAFVSYTPNRPVPADITLAATLIVSHSLLLARDPDRFGLERVQADERTIVQYDTTAARLVVPEAAQRIIAGYRLPVFA